MWLLLTVSLQVLHAALLPSGSAQANEARCSALIDMDGLVRLASTMERTGQKAFSALLSDSEATGGAQASKGEDESEDERAWAAAYRGGVRPLYHLPLRRACASPRPHTPGSDAGASPTSVVRSLLDVVTALADTTRGVAVLAERPRVLQVLMHLASAHAQSGAPDLSAVALKGIASLGKDANVASVLLRCGAPIRLLHLAVFHEGADEGAEDAEAKSSTHEGPTDLLRGA